MLFAGAALIALSAVPAHAEGTQAGTQIKNTARATYGPPDDEKTVDSNEVTLLVDELLDVTITWDDTADVAGSPGQTNRMTTFTVTNAGNGPEKFGLTTLGASGDDMDPAVTSIVIDDGDGTYEPTGDTVYIAGSGDPQLAADATVKVFVFSTIPEDATDGQRGAVNLKAVAVTGASELDREPGTVIEGAGEGGGDAVFGATEADADVDGWYIADVDPTDPDPPVVDLDKEATVKDIYDGDQTIPGSTITYTLTASVSGTGSVSNLRVGDSIPAGTTFKPDSIKLDGTGLTDADDTDAGEFDGTNVSVNLGTVAAGTDHVVTFQVVVDEEN
jgi:uncharacterized repeat protein (TIGR01451 family)